MGVTRTRKNPGNPTVYSKSSDFTVTVAEAGSVYICTSTITATLPSATGIAGVGWTFRNAGTGMVTVGSLIRLAPGEAVTQMSDGSNYYRLNANLHLNVNSPWRWPVTANAADEEFWAGSLDAKWTEGVVGGTAARSYTAVPSHLRVQWGAGDGGDMYTYTQTISNPGSSHAWRGGFRLGPRSSGYICGFGVLTSDLQDGVVIMVGRRGDGVDSVTFYTVAGGSRSEVENHDMGSGIRVAGTGCLLFLQAVSNTWIGKYSFGDEDVGNSISTSGTAKSFTAARLVLYFEQQNSPSEISEMACDFIRKVG